MAEHLRDPQLKKYDLETVYRTDDKVVQCGLEQRLYEQYNAPLDKIRPNSSTNPRLNDYLDAADEYTRGLE